MERKQIYFRDSGIVECWQVVAGYWQRLPDRDAFDDLPLTEWDYYAFDSKPENWLGDRRVNPMPYIQI